MPVKMLNIRDGIYNLMNWNETNYKASYPGKCRHIISP